MKDYDKIIADATRRIANYYKFKLTKQAGKYSTDTCNRMWADAKAMYDGADSRRTPDYYVNYKWMTVGMQMPYIDENVWDTVVESFFTAAREYVVRKQDKYGVSEREEKAVDVAVRELYAKIGKDPQTLEENLKQKPIDYAQSVADTVERIVEFYETKLESVKDDITKDSYDKYKIEIEHLRKGANVEDVTFFTYFKWTHADDSGKLAGDLCKLDEKFWLEVDKFFNGVKAYAEARHNELSLDKCETDLNRLVKTINLKIGGGLFGGKLKGAFLPDTYYMTRANLTDCIVQKGK